MGASRSADTWIFSRQRDRFVILINELKARNQNVLRNVLRLKYDQALSNVVIYPDRFIFVRNHSQAVL